MSLKVKLLCIDGLIYNRSWQLVAKKKPMDYGMLYVLTNLPIQLVQEYHMTLKPSTKA